MVLKKYMKKIFMFCLAALCAATAFAAPAAAQTEYRIEAKTDSAKAVVGEQITLTVTISSNTGTSPDPVRPDFDGFDVAGTSVSNNIMVLNGVPKMDTRLTFVLRPVKTGKLTIGEFLINYTDDAGKARQVKTNPIQIEVADEEKKETAAARPAPSAGATRGRDEEKNQIVSDYMKITTAVIVLIFASIWIIAWQSAKREKIAAIRQKKAAAASGKLQIDGALPDGPEKHGPSQEKISPARGAAKAAGAVPAAAHAPNHARSASEIMAGMQKSLMNQSYKELFSEMARYIRQGLSARTGKDLMEMTTSELSSAVDGSGIQKNHAGDILGILELCDMVCYAKYEPPREEIDRAMASLEKLNNIFERGAR